MVTEDYASYEVAKLLNDKGFDEPCQYFYRFDNNEIFRGTAFTNSQTGDKFYNAPTLQMAMKWLRDVHGLHIQMVITNHGTYVGYVYNTGGFGLCGYDRRREKDRYEEACEAAILFVLEEMI